VFDRLRAETVDVAYREAEEVPGVAKPVIWRRPSGSDFESRAVPPVTL
jgi:hypothetical protein